MSTLDNTHSIKVQNGSIPTDHRQFALPATLLEQMSDVVVAIDEDWHYTYVNPACAQLLGQNREQIVGQLVADLYPHFEGSLSFHMAQKALREHASLEYEEYHPHIERWFRITLYPQEHSLLSISRDITAQKQVEILQKHAVEQELQEKSLLKTERENLYRIFAQAPLPLAIFSGPDHIFQLVSPRYLETVNHRPLLGRSFRTAFPEFAGLGVFEMMDHVYTTGEPFYARNFQANLRHEDGSEEEHFFNFTYQPVRNAQGRVEGVMQVGFEVTEQVHASNSLQISEQRLKLAQKAGHIGMFEWDLVNDVSFCSAELLTIYGLSDSSRLNSITDWLNFVHPDDQMRVQKHLQTYLPTGTVPVFEYRIITAHDQIRWITARGDVYFDKDGCPINTIGINIDITERKLVESALKTSEEKLRLFAESDLIGIIFGSLSGAVTYVNDALLTMLGYTREAFEHGHPTLALMTPPEGHAADLEHAEEAKKTGTCAPYEKEFLHKDGSRLAVTVGYILLGEQREEFVAFVLNDSERKALERRKDEFISMASHELKTPVTTLKAYTQLLKKRFEKEQQHEVIQHLSRMDDQITRLTNLIKELLDVSRMQTGDLAYHDTEIPVDTFLAEVVNTLQLATSTHTLHLSGLSDTIIIGDRDRLEQVLINLVMNAIKYSPQAQVVDIVVEARGKHVLIHVQDYGIGIPSAQRQRIFERFYRIDTAKSKTFPGLGMGLYIAEGIVQRHHGRIQVESTEGQGSTFTIILPCQHL